MDETRQGAAPPSPPLEIQVFDPKQSEPFPPSLLPHVLCVAGAGLTDGARTSLSADPLKGYRARVSAFNSQSNAVLIVVRARASLQTARPSRVC